MRTWLVVARGDRTQRAVAEAAGIRQGYYSMLENNRRIPSVRVAINLGRVLDVDWRMFFEKNESEVENGELI